MPAPADMRVLLTAHRFFPHVGGTEEVVARLASELARRGHDVTVATSDEPGAPTEERREGYIIRRFPLKRAGKFRFPPKAYKEFVARPGWDVVHLHGQRVWSTDYLYRHLARLPAPVVFTAHGFYQYHMERTPLVNDYYYHIVLPRALRHAGAVTALTEGERRELASWGVPFENVTVVPNGLDLAEFASLPTGFRKRHRIPDDGPLVLYVGGFYPNKRVDRIVAAAAEARARLAVVGKDQDPARGLAYCERVARRTGARAHFVGVVPREDVLAAFAESAVFAYASEFEGFGLALLEAMAAGLPFVSTPAGAAPDLAALGAGVVVDDAGALGGSIRALLDDEPRRVAMGARGRAAAARFTWSEVAARYLDVYEAARGSRRSSR